MSTSLLAGRGQQPGSPFGLGHKQAKKPKKIRSKRATVAPYFSCMMRALRKLDRLRLKLYTVRTVNFK